PTATGSAPSPEPPPASGPPPGSLARGDGTPADAELEVADEAYDSEDLKLAKAHYQKAKRLAPKDPAPRVGLIRVALAQSGIATDYAAAPKSAKVRALVRQADAALQLDADYGPAHVE